MQNYQSLNLRFSLSRKLNQPPCKILSGWKKNEEKPATFQENFEIFYQDLYGKLIFSQVFTKYFSSSASPLKVCTVEDNSGILQQSFRFRGGAFRSFHLPTIVEKLKRPIR